VGQNFSQKAKYSSMNLQRLTEILFCRNIVKIQDISKNYVVALPISIFNFSWSCFQCHLPQNSFKKS